MAKWRRGRYEGETFLPMLTASELADRHRPHTVNGVVTPERLEARRRGDEEHARFDREVRRYMRGGSPCGDD